MENIKVRFNMQIMRRGKVVPVGQPFEVPVSELELLKQQGAVVVVEHETSHAAVDGNIEPPADTEPPAVEEILPEVDDAAEDETSPDEETPAEPEPEKKAAGKVSLAEAAKPAKKSK